MWCRVVYPTDYGHLTAELNLNVYLYVRCTAFRADSDLLCTSNGILNDNKQDRQCTYKINSEAHSLSIVALEELSVCS
jgi:hypothetical protein